MNNNLPTLSELPEKFDLTQISPEAARSNAVEALLQQNDDLMARLSVSLRRISELEDKLNFTQQSNEKMKFHYENLKDQVLILKQKAQALAQRKDDSEGFLKGLKDKIRYLEEERRLGEIRYAELYSSHEEKQKQLITRIDQHARRLSRFITYREKIRMAATNFRNKYNEKLKSSIQDKISVESRLQEEIKGLQEHNERLERKVSSSESTLKELRTKVLESTEYIQEQNKKHSAELSELTMRYETKIKSLFKDHDQELTDLTQKHSTEIEKMNTEISRLQRENQQLFDKCSELERVYEENVQLQNKIVFTERKRDEVKNRMEEDVERLQKNLAHYRGDAKSKAAELEELKKAQDEMQNELKFLKEEKLKLEDQVENMQALWRENQVQLEKQNEKNIALQKLNQQLSASINAQRQETTELKNKLDFAQLQISKKMKELKRNSETSQSIRQIERGSGQQQDMTPQLMGKIDTLIAEIQSGFSRK